MSVHRKLQHYPQYVWEAVYKGYVRDVFVIVVLLLGMGGLGRERAHGTSGFTLALPVSRWRLVTTRAAVGLAEAILLSFLPAALLPLLSPLVHETYSWSHTLPFGVYWGVGGALIFTLGFLASELFTGEYSSPVAAFVFLTVYSTVTDLPGVERYVIDVFDMMRATGPHGLWALAEVSATALALITAAGEVTRRRDF